jgi:hypothetical protein
MSETIITKPCSLVCRIHTSIALLALLIFGTAHPVAATENGACVFPVGVETVLTGMQPPPGTSAGYEYTAFYSADELDNVPWFRTSHAATHSGSRLPFL